MSKLPPDQNSFLMWLHSVFLELFKLHKVPYIVTRLCRQTCLCFDVGVVSLLYFRKDTQIVIIYQVLRCLKPLMLSLHVHNQCLLRFCFINIL